MPSASVATFWPSRMWEPSPGDVELGDPVGVARGVAAAGALQAGQRDGEVFGRGVLETTWVAPRLQVVVIDRDIAGCVVAAFGKARGRAEDEVFAVGREVLGDVAVGRWRRGPGSRPGPHHALDEAAVGKVDRDPGVAAFEAGRAALGAAEGEGFEVGAGTGGNRGEGCGREGVVGGDADVFGAPARFRIPGGDIGVDCPGSSGYWCRGFRRRGRRRGPATASLRRGSPDMESDWARGRTRRHSRRCWRRRRARRPGSRGAAPPPSAGEHGRWRRSLRARGRRGTS